MKTREKRILKNFKLPVALATRLDVFSRRSGKTQTRILIEALERHGLKREREIA